MNNNAITILLDAKNSVTDPLARHSIYNAIDYLQRGHYDWCETYQPGICRPVCEGTFAEVA